MKLAPAEAKAIKFVLLLIALSALARWLKRPEPIRVEPAAARVEAAAISPALTQRSTSVALNLNTASLAELDRLPGIGEATARKIIAERPYHTVDDLARVIGRKRAASLAKRAGLSPASPATSNASASTERAARTASPLQPVNLNQATQAELEQLHGVGPSLARRLIAARESSRGFRDWVQVDSVPGVGPALLKKLKAAGTL